MNRLWNRLHGVGSATFRVALGGGAVAPSVESCIQDGTIHLLYDAASGYVPEAGAVSAKWTPRIGGTAADVLTGVLGQEPVYSASDVGFGGLPTVTGNGVGGMISTTPGDAVAVSQPGQIICIGRNHTPVTANNEYIWDGTGAYRWILDKLAGATEFNMYAGSQAATGSAVVDSELNLITAHYDTTSSSFRKRNSSGAMYTSGALSCGTRTLQGLSLFASENDTNPTTFGITAIMVVTGLSAADQARLDAWCQPVMGWT